MAKGQLFTVHRNCNRPNYGAVGTLTEQGMGRMGIPKRLGLEGVALQDSTGSFPFVQRNSTDSTYFYIFYKCMLLNLTLGRKYLSNFNQGVIQPTKVHLRSREVKLTHEVQHTEHAAKMSQNETTW